MAPDTGIIRDPSTGNPIGFPSYSMFITENVPNDYKYVLTKKSNYGGKLLTEKVLSKLIRQDDVPGGKSLIKAFATGGYTGSWGPEGRMAMLHEKELVLNKQDTANILESVDMIRKITNAIDLRSINA